MSRFRVSREIGEMLRRLSRFQPLVIDELSYLTLKPEQTDMFFRLIDQRYSRTSTIITSNLDLPQWYELFHRKPLVDALLDRLQHHCVTIRINGPSLRGPMPAVATSPRAPRRAGRPSEVDDGSQPKPRRSQ